MRVRFRSRSVRAPIRGKLQRRLVRTSLAGLWDQLGRLRLRLTIDHHHASGSVRRLVPIVQRSLPRRRGMRSEHRSAVSVQLLFGAYTVRRHLSDMRRRVSWRTGVRSSYRPALRLRVPLELTYVGHKERHESAAGEQID